MSVTLFSPRLNARAISGTVSQGETSLEWSQPFWGNQAPDSGDLVVGLEVNTGPAGFEYAPHGVSVEVNVSGFADQAMTDDFWDASVHRIWYLIDWGEPGERYTVADGIPEEYKDRNQSVNKKSAHVYRKPGTYMIRAMAYDSSGAWGAAFTTITVKEDDFTANEIIVASRSGNFSGAPYCASANKVTTATALRTRRAAAGAGGRRLVYLKRGETYEADGGEMGFLGQTIIRAWGSGAKPKIDNQTRGGVTGRIVGNERACKFQDIAFTGSWNAVSETSPVAPDVRYNPDALIGLGDDLDVIFDRCDDNGIAMLVQFSSDGGRMIVNENSRTNYKNFFALGGGVGTDIFFLGCSEHQVPGSANGIMFREEFNTGDSEYRYLRNPHNGIRSGVAKTYAWEACDLTQEQGWTLQNTFLNNAIARINTNGQPGCRAFISRCKVEGSITSAHAEGGSMPPVNGVIQQCYLVGDNSNATIFSFQGPGWTIRDNVMVQMDPVQRRWVERFVSFYYGAGPTLNADWDKGRIEIYNNTLVLLTKEANVRTDNFAFIDTGAHPNVYVANNVVYAPNRTVPQISDGPLDETELAFQSRQDGMRRGFERWVNYHTPSATTAPGAVLIVPYGPNHYGATCGPADFAGSWTRNKIAFTSTSYHQPRGTCSFSFQADGIHITNTSGVTWPSGQAITIIADRGTSLMALDTSYAAPAGSLKSFAVAEDSGAYGTATGLVSLFDALGKPRRGSAHPDAAPGSPSRGALEMRML